VEALEELINIYSGPGELVLDPFAGSASTAIAAIGLGRRYFAIEKDDSYFAIAKKRLAEMQSPTATRMPKQQP
jgi:site-specific DNA-methyltransferase (adenine-specific)